MILFHDWLPTCWAPRFPPSPKRESGDCKEEYAGNNSLEKLQACLIACLWGRSMYEYNYSFTYCTWANKLNSRTGSPSSAPHALAGEVVFATTLHNLPRENERRLQWGRSKPHTTQANRQAESRGLMLGYKSPRLRQKARRPWYRPRCIMKENEEEEGCLCLHTHAFPREILNLKIWNYARGLRKEPRRASLYHAYQNCVQSLITHHYSDS